MRLLAHLADCISREQSEGRGTTGHSSEVTNEAPLHLLPTLTVRLAHPHRHALLERGRGDEERFLDFGPQHPLAQPISEKTFVVGDDLFECYAVLDGGGLEPLAPSLELVERQQRCSKCEKARRSK